MLEAFYGKQFTYEKLTEEEQQKRGILGRLVGVIADTLNPTRNGRKYGKKLWEKVFDDPLTQEKIENRCFFGELDHPTDRDTVDSSKIAICLAEKPKLCDDGKLYGVFDILATPNGKILKTLCDYGCNIGVSSRGSGDVMANDEVDPDTYYCECFDAVLIPAVKTARPGMVTESYHVNNKSLRTALTESYKAANEDDKRIMKESIENLQLDVDFTEDPEAYPGGTPKDIDLIPEFEESAENITDNLLEADDEDKDEDEDEAAIDEETTNEMPIDTPSEESTEAEKDTETEAEVEEDDKPVENETTNTVKELINELKGYDKHLEVNFAPLIIEDKEYQIDNLTFDDETEGKLTININYSPIEGDNIESEKSDEEEATSAEEDDITQDEADDVGVTGEVIENFKALVRKNTELEEQLKLCKSEKTVGDAKVKKLIEEVEKYRSSFDRMSTIASSVKTLKESNQTLTEQLKAKDTTISNLKLRVSNAEKLTESATANANKVKALTESLKKSDAALANYEDQLETQKKEFSTKLNEAKEIAKKYKNKFTLVLNKYLESKASMLGVSTAEITNRLNESYTLADIDHVCEDLLTSNINISRLPFGTTRKNINSSAITESIKRPKSVNNDPDYGYEVDESLLDLAGLR